MAKVSQVDLDLTCAASSAPAIPCSRDTQRFAKGLPANNALLWGARGTGKSSLVKAVHAAVNAETGTATLIEIHREDLASLPALLARLRVSRRKVHLLVLRRPFPSAPPIPATSPWKGRAREGGAERAAGGMSSFMPPASGDT